MFEEDSTNQDSASPEVDSNTSPDTAVDQHDQAGYGTAPDAADAGDPNLDTNDQAAALDAEEVEYEGKKYNVPKELKDALMRNVDYTRKTQEVSEQRRALEAQSQEVQQAAQRQQQYLQEYAQLTAIDAQLQRYATTDWNALSQSDPVQAQQMFFQYSQLKDMRGNVVNSLTQKEQQTLEMQRQQTAKQVQESRAILAREIQGWSPEVHKTLSDYAVGMGFSQQEVANAINPNTWKLLHKAHQYDQIIQKTQSSAKPPAGPAPKPATTITARGSGNAPVNMQKLAKETPEEWMRRRNQEIRKR